MNRPRLSAVSADSAYGVPWGFCSTATPGLFVLSNLGREILHGVSISGVVAATSIATAPTSPLTPLPATRIASATIPVPTPPPAPAPTPAPAPAPASVTLGPGESLEMRLSAVWGELGGAVVCWRRPSGDEYLWRVGL